MLLTHHHRRPTLLAQSSARLVMGAIPFFRNTLSLGPEYEFIFRAKRAPNSSSTAAALVFKARVVPCLPTMVDGLAGRTTDGWTDRGRRRVEVEGGSVLPLTAFVLSIIMDNSE